jgi:16S rRNA (adenine1518-N6/adenine1519-N6)-dimethyltransferase
VSLIDGENLDTVPCGPDGGYTGDVTASTGFVLSPPQIQQLAAAVGVKPSKAFGQNFVHDAGTVLKIVRAAAVTPGQRVLEIGPGLGSLTWGLLEAGASVVAVEIDPALAAQLPKTFAVNLMQAAQETPSLLVINKDALQLWPRDIPEPQPTALIANLPYNVAVPIVLTILERFEAIETMLVMVQAEVADRLAAAPGSKVYGVPSAKVAWYASARRSLPISRHVFWPVPNVDSALVAITRRPALDTSAPREVVFQVIDAAFAQRRKTLRAALAGIFGGAGGAEQALIAAGIDPQARGETLNIEQFAAIAAELVAQQTVDKGIANKI